MRIPIADLYDQSSLKFPVLDFKATLRDNWVVKVLLTTLLDEFQNA